MKAWSLLALFAGSMSATLIGLVFLLPIAAQEVAFLDLTEIVIRERLRQPTWGGGTGGGRIGHGRVARPTLPIELTLLSLNKRDYRIGENLIYEVKIQNVGDEETSIPWNPHSADMEPKDPALTYDYTYGYISLAVEDESGETGVLAGVSLYGSPKVPGSLIQLAPGEWVQVRAKLRVGFSSEDWGKKLSSLRRLPLKARARFSLYPQSVAPKDGYYVQSSTFRYPPVKSLNAIPIVVTPNGSSSKQ